MLLQVNQFAMGEVQIIHEFTKMYENLCAKKSRIHNGEFPLELILVLDPQNSAREDINSNPGE